MPTNTYKIFTAIFLTVLLGTIVFFISLTNKYPLGTHSASQNTSQKFSIELSDTKYWADIQNRLTNANDEIPQTTSQMLDALHDQYGFDDFKITKSGSDTSRYDVFLLAHYLGSGYQITHESNAEHCAYDTVPDYSKGNLNVFFSDVVIETGFCNFDTVKDENARLILALIEKLELNKSKALIFAENKKSFPKPIN